MSYRRVILSNWKEIPLVQNSKKHQKTRQEKLLVKALKNLKNEFEISKERNDFEKSRLKYKTDKLENLNLKLKRDLLNLQGELETAKTCFVDKFEVEKLVKTNAAIQICELEKQALAEKQLKLEEQKKFVDLQKSYDRLEHIWIRGVKNLLFLKSYLRIFEIKKKFYWQLWHQRKKSS